MSEPVAIVVTNDLGLVVLNVVDAATGDVHWHVKFQPEDARDLAAKLTLNSIRAEENTPGRG